MKSAQKQANIPSNRTAIETSHGSGQNPLAQAANNSKEAAAQRALIAGVNDSPRMLAQRRQIDGYLGANQPRADGAVHPALPLQGKCASESTAQRRETIPKTNNTGLPDTLKSGIENLSGLSMDNVKVHYNSSQPAQLNAFAYAQGTDIHLAPGQEQHLPHEAWHVVQQAQGRVQPTMRMAGVAVNNEGGLEREADVMGERALVGGGVGVESAQRKGGCGRAENARSQPIQKMAVVQLVFIGTAARFHVHRVGGNEHYKYGNEQASRQNFIHGGHLNQGNLQSAINKCEASRALHSGAADMAS